MINFPVLPGVSGHLLGGALAGILLGPWMGCLVLATVLLVQAIGFADGGITALGANISLMALIAAVGGYYLFRMLTALLPRTRRGFSVATAVTAWATVVLASVVASVYISIGGFAGGDQLSVVLPVMVGVHALIGIGEAFITTAVVMAVVTARPDLVATADRLDAPRRVGPGRTRPFILAGLLAAVALGAGLSHLASSAPDGLEASVLRTACADASDPEACLAQAAGDPAFRASPLPDYSVLWLSGLLGVAACFALGAGAVRAARREPVAPQREREKTLT
jgi:cobalt/nickel transport system permease protein